MMKSNMWKSTFREIKQSFGRFMAIFAIIALGVGMFAGLKVTRPAMVKTVDRYLKEKQFYDYRILSTLGFEKEDVDALGAKADVRSAEGIVSFDIMANIDGGSDIVLKTYNLPQQINGIELLAGQMPENASECIADSGFFTEADIGKKLVLSKENEEEDLERFTEREFTITGIAQSSAYIQYERGNTSLGNGQIRGFVYLPWESYDVDYYTEILVKFDEDFDIYSSKYDSYMEKKDAQWERFAVEAANNRYDRIIAEGQEKLDDANVELNDAKQEFADGKAEGEAELKDAKSELRDALKKLRDGEKELADGKTEMADGRQRMKDSRAQLISAEGEIAADEKKLQDGEKEILANQKLLDEKKAEAEDGRKMLNAGQQEIDAQKQQLSEASAGLSQAKGQTTLMKDGLADIEQNLPFTAVVPGVEEQLGAALTELEAGALKLFAALCPGEELPEMPPTEKMTLEERAALLKQQLTTLDSVLAAQEEAITAGEAQLTDAQAELDKQRQALDAGEAELAAAQTQLTDAKQEIENGKSELEAGKRQLADGWRAFSDAEAELSKGEQELKDAEKELADGWKEYKDGLKEYEDGVQEFNDKIADGEKEIAFAEKKLSDAQKELDDVEEPESFLLDREKNVGYVCFENDSTIVDGIANVFPVFFFAVAALVCITTMSRMIEEQRTQIGVLKALGYSEATIIGKYLFYSGTAAVTGCLAGFFGGSWIFPNVIWNAYGIMYDVGGVASVLDWKIGLISLVVSLGCSIGTTYLTCHKELSEVAAELMRPKAPKAGKRVLMERITFIWKRLKFLHKVSYRNVFRYKRRFLMMVIGISGCMGLMLTGFGVRDSVTTLADDQYDEIQVYDMNVTLADEITEETFEKLKKTAGDGSLEMLPLMEKSIDLTAGGKTKPVTLVTVDETADIAPFVKLKDVAGGELAYPGDMECVICEKLAETLGVGVGDTVTLEDDKHHTMELTVSGVFRNYIMNYVYMTEQTYEQAGNHQAEEKTVYMNLREDQDVHQLSADMMKLDEVAAVTATADTKARFAGMMDSMDLIVGIIILCAAGLAFIVLYNLTNINITERVREIATIKVLGFYKNETASYIFRENLILTSIGALAGLGLGNLFHRFVMMQIRLDQIEFEIRILPLSYLYSILLTFVFAFFINLVMSRKLDRISMTESLKSVD